MISTTTKIPLAQFLSVNEPSVTIGLLIKHGGPTCFSIPRVGALGVLQRLLQDIDQGVLLKVVEEVTRTQASLRREVSPKPPFDERYADLVACLRLDGYVVVNGRLQTVDPSIGDGEPIEDDLITGLNASRFPRREAVVQSICASTQAFRAARPDYNAALTHVRVALETLAIDLAAEVAARNPTGPAYNATKWGSVISFLRLQGVLTTEEEKGLAGVYGFVSPGAHRLLGLTEEEMARLGRSIALAMSWFLVKLAEGMV